MASPTHTIHAVFKNMHRHYILGLGLRGHQFIRAVFHDATCPGCESLHNTGVKDTPSKISRFRTSKYGARDACNVTVMATSVLEPISQCRAICERNAQETADQDWPRG